jgi:hypothetical protein
LLPGREAATLETPVKKILTISAALTAMALSACAYDDGPHGGGVAVGVTANNGGYYGAYYDDYYDPFNDGYRGDDGFFYYADTGHAWHRDDARHFRRDNGGASFHAVHGSGAHREH